MVVIVTPQTVDMQGDPRRLGEALQAVGDHLGAEVTNLLALEAEVDHAVGSIGEVDDGPAEGLI